MRILQLHADFIEYELVGKEISLAEEADKERVRENEVVVLFTTFERGDDEKVVQRAVGEVKSSIKKIGASRLLIYPYSHLSSELASPSRALELTKLMEKYSQEEGFEVTRAPFGWTKAFNIKIKGHPLAEQSKSFSPEEVKVTRGEMKKDYVILTPSGKEHTPRDHLPNVSQDFIALVKKEALGAEARGGQPKFLDYCKKFGIEWESMSDIGHMRYQPQGSLIFELVSEYSNQIIHSLGIPVFNVRGTNMFNLDIPAVKQHADLFGGRLYEIKIDDRNLVMRYAACHQQFAIVKDWQISYKHLPFGAFEVADSYRHEQSGELLLSFRVRKLHMPDLHIFCKDLGESEKIFRDIHARIFEEIEKLGRNYEILINLTSRKFYQENKKFLLDLLKSVKRPALIAFYPPGADYYWVINIEYHITDELGRPREIGTVQIDTGNAERFGIKYTDENGREKFPVIIHTAIVGTLERYLYVLLDSAARDEKNGKVPSLPLWLSPTQVRLIPISNKQFPWVRKIESKLEENGIRVDIDDRNETLSKKVRDAETEWISYIVVIGEKEKKSQRLSVRIREEGVLRRMKSDRLVSKIRERTEGYPFKPLPMPVLLSQRPSFGG